MGIGINGKILEAVRDFLSVDGETSSIRIVLSGVLQGSVLGLLLFFIFIKDLPHCLNSSSKLFADDLKLIVDANCTDIQGHTGRSLARAAPPILLLDHIIYTIY